MSGNPSLSRVLYMYIHIYTHTCEIPLCLPLYEISMYLSNMQPIQKEAKPQITGD